MSRQDVGRAALRLLTSHVEMEEGDERQQQHHYDPIRNQYQQQSTSPTSPSTSYFGGSALQITESPSTSPNLGPSHYHHRFDSLPRTRTGRSRIGQGSSGTPTTSDVPSLSLSNSSFSDGPLRSPLRSPLSEQAPSQASISSTSTVHQQHYLMAEEDDRRDAGVPQSTLIRVAHSLQMPLDDVRRVERCMSQDFGSEKGQESILIEDLGRDRFYKIVGAVRAEEVRLSHSSSIRSTYLRANTDTQQRRQHHASVTPPMPSRSAGFGSPPPNYEQLDFMDRSGPIPSPRAALELLTANSSQSAQYGNSNSPIQGFEQSFSRGSPHRHSHWNISTSPYHTHTRQTSAGTRPISLPDRSYRSMDDYVSQPPPKLTSSVLRGPNRLSIRRSIHGLINSPNEQHPPISRQSSRSPLIDSPQEDDDMEETLNDDYFLNEGSSRHLRPGPSQSRQRSATGVENELHNDLVKPSRRASAEVLGQAFKRASSPLVIQEEDSIASSKVSVPPTSTSSSSTPPLSHEEVMARLQRKVKERLAAKNAGLDFSSSNVIVGGRSKSMKATSSPSASKHSSLPYGTQPASLGRGGRRRQESLANLLPPSSSRRSLSNSRKQVKSPSLRGIARELEQKGEVEDAKMEDISSPMGSDTAGMGIEALLSAAAIADSPRRNFI